MGYAGKERVANLAIRPLGQMERSAGWSGFA